MIVFLPTIIATVKKSLAKRSIRDLFSENDLLRIKDACREAEENTSGEIRVDIRHRYEKGVNNVEEQIRRDFTGYGMEKTRERTGVLILLVLKQRQFAILGDEGIHQKLGQDYWYRQAALLAQNFQDGNFAGALCAAVRDVGEKLALHFPCHPDDSNELPDDVIVGPRE